MISAPMARGMTLDSSTSASCGQREVPAQQRLGLLLAVYVGQAGAAGRSADDPVEPGVRISVADENQTHGEPP